MNPYKDLHLYTERYYQKYHIKHDEDSIFQNATPQFSPPSQNQIQKLGDNKNQSQSRKYPKFQQETAGSIPKKRLSPHIFGIGKAAYIAMCSAIQLHKQRTVNWQLQKQNHSLQQSNSLQSSAKLQTQSKQQLQSQSQVQAQVQIQSQSQSQATKIQNNK